MRFEVAHVYFAQHCFFLPLPQVLVGIQNAAATSGKKRREKILACIREIQVHKLWTKVYSQNGLTAMHYTLQSTIQPDYILAMCHFYSSVNHDHNFCQVIVYAAILCDDSCQVTRYTYSCCVTTFVRSQFTLLYCVMTVVRSHFTPTAAV